MRPEINTYIEKRYQGLLDYAAFHSSRAGIPEEAADILDEVLLSLLQMDEQKLLNMLDSKKCKYTELDFFILRMIKLNCYSETAPYQSKYRPMPSSNIDFRRLNIEDVTDSEVDTPAIILKQFAQVRDAFESLNLSPKAKRIFEFKFFQDQPFCEWSGPETKKQLYETYSQVVNLIRAKIFKKTLL